MHLILLNSHLPFSCDSSLWRSPTCATRLQMNGVQDEAWPLAELWIQVVQGGAARLWSLKPVVVHLHSCAQAITGQLHSYQLINHLCDLTVVVQLSCWGCCWHYTLILWRTAFVLSFFDSYCCPFGWDIWVLSDSDGGLQALWTVVTLSRGDQNMALPRDQWDTSDFITIQEEDHMKKYSFIGEPT